jgi:multiple sugar transport system substrate-binding protein
MNAYGTYISKKICLIFLIITTIGLHSFAGGGAQPSRSQDGPIELTFMHVFGGARGEAITKVVDAFNASQQGIVVRHEMANGWYGGLLERLQTLAVARQLPEIAIMGLSDSNYMRQGLRTISVQHYIERDNFDLTDFIPGMLSLATDQFTGEIFALPYAISTPLIYVNKDLLRAAGINADRQPESWSELADWARAANNYHSNAAGIAFQLDFDTWQFQQLLESFGGVMADIPGRRVLFNQEPGRRVLDFWLNMMHTDGSYLNISGSEAADNFINGSLAIIVATTGNMTRFEQNATFDMGVLLLPQYDDMIRRNPRRIPAGGSNIYILPSTEEKQAAAWEFIKFAISPESTRIIVEDMGYMSARQSLLNPNGLLSDFAQTYPQALRSYEQLDDLVGWFNWPGVTGARITQIMLDNINAAFNREKTSEQALNDAAQEARRILGW